MSSRTRRKKKKRSESDEEISFCKRLNLQTSPEGTDTISQVLNKANSVLFDQCDSLSISNLFEPLVGVSDSHDCYSVQEGSDPRTTMEDNTCNPGSNREGPTNSDIVAMLGQITLKLNDMDSRLQTLDGIEKKVENFDKDLKKLWLHIDDMAKDTSAKLNRVEDKVESAAVDIDGARRRIADLERDNGRMKDDMNYMKSQSMRNNIILGNIPEAPGETPAMAEKVAREFFVNQLKIAQETADNIKFEIVHRMGQKLSEPRPNERGASTGATSSAESTRHRSIVCKFSFYSDKEMVRGQSRNLKGTKFYVSEHFPPDIAAKRRRLFRRAKEEKEAGKKAWVSYDTLYVDGRPVKDA